MLREMQSVDHVVCRSTLEAAVLESRLIAQLLPRYNRRGTRWKKYVYLKLTAEPFPRLAVVRAPKVDGGHYLGPLPSTRVARLVADAIETVVPLRRCTAAVRPGRAVARVAVRAGPARHVAVSVRRGRLRRASTGPSRRVSCAGSPASPSCCSSRSASAWRAWPRPSASRKRPTSATGPPRSRPRSPANAACCSYATAAGSSSIWATPAASSSIGAASPERGSTASSRWGSPSAPASTGPRAGADGWIPVDVADELACVASWLDANARKVRLVQCEGRARFHGARGSPARRTSVACRRGPGARGAADRHHGLVRSVRRRPAVDPPSDAALPARPARNQEPRPDRLGAVHQPSPPASIVACAASPRRPASPGRAATRRPRRSPSRWRTKPSGSRPASSR